MLQTVDGYDWPLLAVFVLLVMSFLVVLHALRTSIDVLATVWLKFRMARRTRLLNGRTNQNNPAVVR